MNPGIMAGAGRSGWSLGRQCTMAQRLRKALCRQQTGRRLDGQTCAAPTRSNQARNVNSPLKTWLTTWSAFNKRRNHVHAKRHRLALHPAASFAEELRSFLPQMSWRGGAETKGILMNHETPERHESRTGNYCHECDHQNPQLIPWYLILDTWHLVHGEPCPIWFRLTSRQNFVARLR